MTIYNDPAEAGLEIIGEAEKERDYDFDKFVAWRRLADGVLLYGQDSGCSCPSPFENTSASDLVEFNTYQEFDGALTEWHAEQRRSCEGVAELRVSVRLALNERGDYSGDLMAWREKHIRVRRNNVPL